MLAEPVVINYDWQWIDATRMPTAANSIPTAGDSVRDTVSAEPSTSASISPSVSDGNVNGSDSASVAVRGLRAFSARLGGSSSSVVSEAVIPVPSFKERNFCPVEIRRFRLAQVTAAAAAAAAAGCCCGGCCGGVVPFVDYCSFFLHVVVCAALLLSRIIFHCHFHCQISSTSLSSTSCIATSRR